jgi:uncharacterized iron-regulated protein
MTEKLDPFLVEIRLGLSMIEGGLGHLNDLVDEKTVTTEQELRERFAETDKLLDQIRAEARTAQDGLKQLIEEEKSETSEVVAEWKATRLTSKLHARADRCERFATTAIEVAVLAMEEAKRAVLCALLTRKETISIQIKRCGDGPS